MEDLIMLKVLPLLLSTLPLLLTSSSGLSNPAYKLDDLYEYAQENDESYTINKVKDSALHLTDFRIYGQKYNEGNKLIKKVNTDTFKDINLSSIMISEDVEIYLPSLNNVTIFYTGNEEQFANFLARNNLSNEDIKEVYFEACDEGFLNFWSENISPLNSICDLLEPNMKDTYDKLMRLYNGLALTQDKYHVDKIMEDEQTIGETIEYLSSLINPQMAKPVEIEMEQDTMLIFILIVASIGMTSICIFYLLREKNIID